MAPLLTTESKTAQAPALRGPGSRHGQRGTETEGTDDKSRGVVV